MFSNGVLYRLYRANAYCAASRHSTLHVSWPGRGANYDLWSYTIKVAGYSPKQIRGAKSTATVKLKELPQGILNAGLEVLTDDENGPTYPTVVQQARANMRKYESCVLLTRVGGFYELYLDQADEYGPLLNLKVAQKKTTVGPVSMAGFPFFQLDRFLKILVQDLNKFVAISEEFANDAARKVKSGGLMFDRRVSRIVTPGTLVDEKFLDPYANNFLLAVSAERQINKVHQDSTTASGSTEVPGEATQAIGLAWLDLSTGEFYTQSTKVVALPTALIRIGAKEIIISSTMDQQSKEAIEGVFGQDRYLVTRQQHDAVKSITVANWSTMLETPVPASDHAMFTREEILAGDMLLEYAADKLQGQGITLQPPIRKLEIENMGIDRHSMQGLEILETTKDGLSGGKGSLLHAMRRTVTKGGTRLLRDRISSPSTSLTVICERLNLVELFLMQLELREGVLGLLRRTYDSQRLVQKFALGRGDADDLLSLLRTIIAVQNIFQLLHQAMNNSVRTTDKLGSDHSLASIIQRFSLDGPNVLASRIAEAIDEEGLMASHRNEQMESAKIVSMAQEILEKEGTPTDYESMPRALRSKPSPKDPGDQGSEDDDTWVMRRNASPTLEKLHRSLTDLRQKKTRLTVGLRQQAETSSLTLRWTPGLGHVCHVKGTKDVRMSAANLPSARSASSTKSTRSFYVSEWSTLGGQIDQVRFQIQTEEQRVFQTLRAQVVLNIVKIRRNSAVLDELDVACSSAVLAEEQGFVRPKLNDRLSHIIVGGRHPTVKLGLEEQGRSFVSNDCFVGEEQRVWLITGPNMAGKSTFLRQNALISILAQVGSFVPAEHAEIGIVDNIFSRVGSADNLFKDQSTFMVEMLETAAILKNATRRSFVIMDEVGRGTTPEDGIAVGFACLHHLYHTNRCRTLFATHFHVLADMTKDWDNLGCYCTDVEESSNGTFSYIHRLRPGVNRQSHALKVARLAGIPESAIRIAEKTLGSLQGPLPQRMDGSFSPDRAEASLLSTVG